MADAFELSERLARVQARIESAARRCGRAPESVRLVAVSKRKSAALIREAYAHGLRDFGENYAQELRDKARELADLKELRWHFIGPLQRNKVRLVAGVAHTFHALCSPALAEALDQRLAASAAEPLRVLIQVNLSGEASKSGIAPGELPRLLESVRAHSHLRCVGLMTMPPPLSDPELVAPYFEQLAEIAAAHALPELSMGMSDDFEVAVSAGATLVRIGSSIFGPRS